MHMERPSLAGMATKVRRPRGTAQNAVGLYVDVRPEIKQQLDRIVAETGSSKWAVVEALIARGAAELDSGEDLSWIPTARTDDVLEGMPDLRTA